MSVKTLLVTHEGIASSLLRTAEGILNREIPEVLMIEVAMDADLERLLAETTDMVEQSLDGADLLIIADLIGSSPYNVARNIQHHFEGSSLVSGINLPMLIKAASNAELPLDQLVMKVVEGGKACITGEHDAT